MDNRIKVILLALECLLKTTASRECNEFWKLTKEELDEYFQARENYINKTIKYINLVNSINEKDKKNGIV